MASAWYNRIVMWEGKSVNPTRNITGGLSDPHSVFATPNGDVYIDNYALQRRIDKWTPDTTHRLPFMYVAGQCDGLFVDINDNLYCTQWLFHVVVRKAAADDANTSSIVAGNGSCGSASNMLCNPIGIFVDITLSMYIADSGNDRVQLFKAGQLNGTTVAGIGAAVSFALKRPNDVMLDEKGYLFILDSFNNRIVRSGPQGFWCVVGCSETSGAGSNQLNAPWTFTFDSVGNIFVADRSNNRIQKFSLVNNSCGEFDDAIA